MISPSNRLALYTQPATNGKALAATEAFEAWTDVPVSVVLDFVEHRATWDQFRWAPFAEWRRIRESGRRLVISVGLPVGATLEACAAGEYDGHWRDFASRLVSKGLADTPMRLLWEFNGNWFSWSARGREATYAQAFRSIVNAMRNVEGGEFAFDWCGMPLVANSSLNFAAAWPGDEFVDVVGVDVYDKDLTHKYYAGNAPKSPDSHIAFWRLLAQGRWGLADWVEFADQHGKPFVIDEWGVVIDPKTGEGGGDNAYFVDRMLRLIDHPANRVLWATYFEFDNDKTGVLHALSSPSTAFPESADVFLARVRERAAAEQRLTKLTSGPWMREHTTRELADLADLIERGVA